jgi:kinesin family protein 1
MAEPGDGNIKVVVRCRPLNARGTTFTMRPSCHVQIPLTSLPPSIELARGAKGLIRMQGNQTFLDPPEPTDSKRATERKAMTFSFDKSYWSAGPRDEPQYCSQQTLYDDLGKELLDHGFAGFNACILACESHCSVLVDDSRS